MKRCVPLLFAGLLSAAVSTFGATPPATPGEWFSLNKVWDVRLEFPAGQWQALEPKGGGDGPFGGGPGGRGGFNPIASWPRFG
jgi:hypothetical protein